MVTESLIRLRIPAPDGAPLLPGHPMVRAGRGKANLTGVDSTFFDTPDLRLHRQGVTLELVKVKDGWRQQVRKGKGRAEVAKLAGEAFDAKRLARSAAGKLLGKGRVKELAPLFHLSGQQGVWRLRFPEGSELELVEEWGTRSQGEQAQPYHDLSLALRNGSPVRLVQTALSFAHEYQTGVTALPPLARAFLALDPGQQEAPPNWKPLLLAPQSKAEEAYTRIHTAIMGHLNASLGAALHGEAAARAEGLRAIHGAVTRLRTLVTLYHALIPTEMRQEMDHELKWMLAELDPAFDWEAFVTEILDPFGAHFSHYPGAAVLRQAAEEHRARAYARMEAVLNSFRFARLLLGVINWTAGHGWRSLGDGSQRLQMASAARVWAKDALDIHHRHVRKTAKQFSDLNAEGRLRLREEGDVLLEAIDFFGGLFPAKEVAAYRAAFSKVQRGLRVLGRLDDAARLFQEAFPGEDDPTVHLIRGWLGARTESALNETEAAWKRFSGGLVFWQ